MKFLSLALLATPALTQSLKQALDAASPLGKQFAAGIAGDQKAQDALVPAGKSQVTLFLPTDKALDDHRSNAPRPSKSKRALKPEEYAIAAYSSADGKQDLTALSAGGVLKTNNVDAGSGKANDLVAEGGSGKLRLRANTTTPPPISVFGGLGAKAAIVAGDFVFDQGVIHFVDTVMDVPQLTSFTIATLGYRNFLGALAAAGLSPAIDKSTTTLLVYRDDVFTSAANQSVKSLQQHIIPNFLAYGPSLVGVTTLTTAANTTLKVSVVGGQYFINDSPIVKSNIISSNGVVHVLGKLLTGPTITTYTPTGSDATSSRVNQITIVGALFLAAWNYLV
ncbi:FAS1 domain-containing protein [Tuber borchii]|uniref:FAS1 domain-containing protein n=1 Tax=Tuber borchii TaxID=42251 RepID=A0A2T6ZQK8_TUBBO|nr:FAS1 domain-containing protein [Tuber borchii]